MKTKITTIVITALVTALVMTLVNKQSDSKIENSTQMEQSGDKKVAEEVIPSDTTMWISLTVAEGKRLIAKGLVKYAPVAKNLESGELIVTKGSSNHYLLEELLGKDLQKGSFLSGRIMPKVASDFPKIEKSYSEVLFKSGQPKELDLDEALKEVNSGSVVFKGGNLMNYSRGEAYVLVMHPTGGTIAKLIPYIERGKTQLIIPMGLEKNSSYNLTEMSAKYATAAPGVPRVILLPGELFTEIEAIKQFAKVNVTQIASGGINGAEGAVSLMIDGTKEEVDKVTTLMESVWGESSFPQ